MDSNKQGIISEVKYNREGDNWHITLENVFGTPCVRVYKNVPDGASFATAEKEEAFTTFEDAKNKYFVYVGVAAVLGAEFTHRYINFGGK